MMTMFPVERLFYSLSEDRMADSNHTNWEVNRMDNSSLTENASKTTFDNIIN